MPAPARSTRFVAWSNAVLAGHVSPDLAAARITGSDPVHRVDGLPDGSQQTLPVVLARLSSRQSPALRLVLPLPGDPVGMRGELLVHVERAWQVGSRRRGWSASRELALYIAHGCDHLNDAEDATPAGRQRMRRRELRWLRRVQVPDGMI